MKQFYVVPINDDEFSLTPSALNVGCMYFVHVHSNGRYGSARVGVSGPKLESNAMLGGIGGGTQYRNTVRKIDKYRNTESKIDEILIPHLFSVTFT